MLCSVYETPVVEELLIGVSDIMYFSGEEELPPDDDPNAGYPIPAV